MRSTSAPLAPRRLLPPALPPRCRCSRSRRAPRQRHEQHEHGCSEHPGGVTGVERQRRRRARRATAVRHGAGVAGKWAARGRRAGTAACFAGASWILPKVTVPATRGRALLPAALQARAARPHAHESCIRAAELALKAVHDRATCVIGVAATSRRSLRVPRSSSVRACRGDAQPSCRAAAGLRTGGCLTPEAMLGFELKQREAKLAREQAARLEVARRKLAEEQSREERCFCGFRAQPGRRPALTRPRRTGCESSRRNSLLRCGSGASTPRRRSRRCVRSVQGRARFNAH